MQRRKVDISPNNNSDNGIEPHASPSKTLERKLHGKSRTTGHRVILVLVLFTSILLLVMLFFPSQVMDVEEATAKKTKDFMNNVLEREREMEKQVGDMLHSHEKSKSVLTNEDASERMKKQPSSWVDGEKKLKQKLKVLLERQKQGKDLGVPVLTRYLGEDIPAWPGEGVDRDEWQKRVDGKYKEMAETEKQWRVEMKQKLDELDKINRQAS
jgi:hypothetical protein